MRAKKKITKNACACSYLILDLTIEPNKKRHYTRTNNLLSKNITIEPNLSLKCWKIQVQQKCM